MRHNLPVTQNEYPFPRGETLVSTTDTQGRILYCNPAFIEVSGYQQHELLGQPHNLIRHPDMPEEAFRDMWQTIASGKPWSAPVKNRRKNGDYYWVIANATPLMVQGRPAGYMSVRTEASRAQIEAAEALYARMRAERELAAPTLRLSGGRLTRNTPLGRLADRLRPGLSAKMLLVLLAVVAVNLVLGWLLPAAQTVTSPEGLLLKLGVLLLGWMYLSHLVVRPLDALIAAANNMAAADLTQPPAHTRKDQLGELQLALRQLNVTVMSVVRDARAQSAALLSGTQEIASGNQDLSSRTEAQAGNLEQTAASMEQITATVRQTADAAAEASQLAVQVSAVAERSLDAVDAAGETMAEIQAASARVGEITEVIDLIAFQTNILALNAAVEAARAGEQGRGFAVVAAEVRALAQRTSTAAKQIKSLIEDAGGKVQQGHKRTEVARNTLHEAVDGVRRVTTLVGEISQAAREQLSGISEVNAAVTQLDGITQQNAALVEEIAASAQALEGVAQTVTETVKVFRLTGAVAAAPDAVALRRAAKLRAVAA